MSATGNDFLTLCNEAFDSDEIVLVMKNGIRAIACRDDTLYYFVCYGYAFALQLLNNKIVGWNRLNDDWEPDDHFPVSLKVLTTPGKTARQIAPAIGELAGNKKLDLALKFAKGDTTSALPPQSISMVNTFLKKLPDQESLGRIAQGEYQCEEGWALLSLVTRYPAARELFRQNPALAYILTEVASDSEDIEELLRKPRREIVSRFGFPVTESIVRILEKISPSAIVAFRLQQLGEILKEKHLTKLLSHLKRINAEVIRVVTNSESWPYLSGKLLQEVSSTDKDIVSTEIFEILLHRSNIPGFNCPVFRSVAGVRSCYRLVMEELNRLEMEWINAGWPLPDPPLAGMEDIITPITDVDELRREGSEMVHCVATYSSKIRRGGCYVYRLHRPERATVCIEYDGSKRRWCINDVKLAYNASPKSSTLEIVNNWLWERQISVERQIVCA